MSNKKVEIMIDNERIVVELYVDKAPLICNLILDNLPVEGTVQHAKLNGQLFFATLPFTTPFENKCPGGALKHGETLLAARQQDHTGFAARPEPLRHAKRPCPGHASTSPRR